MMFLFTTESWGHRMVLAASRRMVARFLVVAVAAVAVSCADESAPGPDYVVGAGDSVESDLLAQIYAGALARTGLRVSVETGLGDRAAALAALDAGTVSLLGEHNGDLLEFFDSGATARKPDDVKEALYGSLPEGLVVADAADGTDLRPRVLISTAAGVRSVAQLGERCAGTVAVAPVPVWLAPAGPVRVAACDLDFAAVEPMRPGPLLEALRDGRIQVGVLSGPPIGLAADALRGVTVLTDDEYAVRARNVLPVFRKGSLNEVRVKKLNYVGGELTTEEFVELVRRITAGEVSSADAARAWLDAHAL
ncbi:glycine betaine ABC transporter substrate-binding protein [Nocardia sp. NPDC127579]|uniref:glycine betaine ABC transporter substrate-binding protein n=1 Tax=Nocardia sp. NPDC127579 TaxID=3345402 RepID=UPI003644A068